MAEHPNPGTWWKHRRRFAYMSFIVLCLIASGALMQELKAPNADVLAGICYMLGLIIMTYIGAATVSDIGNIKK